MENIPYSVIIGSGSYIPERVVKNSDFLTTEFYDTDGSLFKSTNEDIINKFLEITTIAERRYADDQMVTSDLAYLAGEDAIKKSGIDPETLDFVIVAHNFGDVKAGTTHSDIVPSLAARVKHRLGIKNPSCVAYDLIFGCPGWLQAVIHANYFIRSGDAKRVLVIGAEALSRVYDPHDRDGMIYADGAGAVILEGQYTQGKKGLIAHSTRSDTLIHSKMLHMGKSYHRSEKLSDDLLLKMNGRRLYAYALETVPLAIKECLQKANMPLKEVKKLLIHQANGKMDDAILERLYSLCETEVPADVMPMTITWLGNSSVATIPTLYDLIEHGQLQPHSFNEGDKLVFASVGAGMNINAAAYIY